MLAKRFKYDGKSITRLNEAQVRAKKQIEKKINEGIYQFEKISCYICGGKNFETLSEKDQYGLWTPVGICRDCGLIQANPRMTQEAYNQFYDAEYRKLYGNTEFPPEYWFHKSRRERGKRIYNYLKKNLRINISGLRVFEVGTARGGILYYFKEKGNEVYGCDLDTEYIAFGRDKYDLNLEVGTIADVVLPWTPDIVIYSHVLEHILNPIEEMSRLRSIIDDSTIVYIEVPSLSYMKDYCGGDFLPWIQNAHVYYFTLKTLRNLMNKAGYDFVCGNKIIYSVFKKSSTQMEKNYESDYVNAMFFLRSMEFYRVMPTPYNIKRLTMPALISFLKRAGLYNTAKRAYYKFKS